MPNLEAPDQPADSRDFAAVAERDRGINTDIFRVKVTQAGADAGSRRAYGARVRLAAGSIRLSIYHLVEEEAAHGRAVLSAPVYVGAGAIIWFEAGADPPPQTVFAALLIFAGWLFLKREAGRALAAFAVCWHAAVLRHGLGAMRNLARINHNARLGGDHHHHRADRTARGG